MMMMAEVIFIKVMMMMMSMMTMMIMMMIIIAKDKTLFYLGFERDIEKYKSLDVQIVGVSVDSVDKHLDFGKNLYVQRIILYIYITHFHHLTSSTS